MNKKYIGLVLIFVGCALMFWGYNESNSLGEQIGETFTGSFSDRVMLLGIGGGAVALIGLFQLKGR